MQRAHSAQNQKSSKGRPGQAASRSGAKAAGKTKSKNAKKAASPRKATAKKGAKSSRSASKSTRQTGAGRQSAAAKEGVILSAESREERFEGVGGFTGSETLDRDAQVSGRDFLNDVDGDDSNFNKVERADMGRGLNEANYDDREDDEGSARDANWSIRDRDDRDSEDFENEMESDMDESNDRGSGNRGPSAANLPDDNSSGH